MRFKLPEIRCMQAIAAKLDKFAEVVEKQFVDKNRKAVRFNYKAEYVLDDVHKNVNEAFNRYLDSDRSRKEIKAILQVFNSPGGYLGDANNFNMIYGNLKSGASRVVKIVEQLDKQSDVSIIKGLQYELPQKMRDLANDAQNLADWLRRLYADSEKAEATQKETMSKAARALVVLKDHPNWSNTDIAKAAGVHPKSLSRMKDFCKARKILKTGKSNIPNGSKDAETGDLEAWEK